MDEGVSLVRKPVSFEALGRKVRETLEAGAGDGAPPAGRTG